MNPRSRSSRDNGFQDRRLQPLGHPSAMVLKIIIKALVCQGVCQDWPRLQLTDTCFRAYNSFHKKGDNQCLIIAIVMIVKQIKIDLYQFGYWWGIFVFSKRHKTKFRTQKGRTYENEENV